MGGGSQWEPSIEDKDTVVKETDSSLGSKTFFKRTEQSCSCPVHKLLKRRWSFPTFFSEATFSLTQLFSYQVSGVRYRDKTILSTGLKLGNLGISD